ISKVACGGEGIIGQEGLFGSAGGGVEGSRLLGGKFMWRRCTVLVFKRDKSLRVISVVAKLVLGDTSLGELTV
nr:hypothetical protein [Tanacetum cinerariifolium]